MKTKDLYIGQIIFKEDQLLYKAPYFIVLGVTIGLVGVLMLFLIFKQIFDGNSTDSGSQDWTTLLIVFFFIAGLLVFLGKSKLTIEVGAKGFRFKYPLFINSWRSYAWSEIKVCKVIEYNPLWLNGGWGIRYSLINNTWTYSVWGKSAMEVNTTSGKTWLIGIQNPNGLKDALHTVGVLKDSST